MRRLAGYTLAEVLVVMVIVSILAGIVGALVPKAQLSAKATRSLTEMRQISIAVNLYREVWGVIPTASSDQRISWGSRLNISNDLFQGCGWHPNNRVSQSVVYFFIRSDWDYQPWIDQFGDYLPVAYDMNCSSPETHVENQFESKVGLAVNFTGTAIRRRQTGDPNQALFWISQLN